ncbi:unnamed protein product [Owenia fusiformis]|uniref:BHLH domain-containing protein n=1 Tax=Owenia fusiformis TaxID=6347 RepID=A0A8S4Q2R6_OWEFU|nr:unnamed protein product [Owenia fusiformis]
MTTTLCNLVPIRPADSIKTEGGQLTTCNLVLLQTVPMSHTVTLSPTGSTGSTGSTPNTNSSGKRLLKRAAPDQPEQLRCKRRLDFNKYNLPKPAPQQVARRNERERNRVKLVNLGFNTLREHVPEGQKNKKMSKVETLRSAVEYIKHLQELLDENDAINAAFNSQMQHSPIDSLHGQASPGYSSDSSGGYNYSNEFEQAPLSPEEQELLSTIDWFQ